MTKPRVYPRGYEKTAVTASHKPKARPAIQKTPKTMGGKSAVQKRLETLHDELDTWRAVADALGGLDRGLLCRVANGKHPPRSVAAAVRAYWRGRCNPHLPPEYARAAAWLGERERR